MGMSRRIRVSMALVVGLALAFSGSVAARWVLDTAGQRYIQRWRELRAGERDREDARLHTYRRPFVSGEPREQNAAVWYRLSLARIPTGWLSDSTRVERLLRDDVSNNAAELDAVMSGPCAESQSSRMVEALRSTACFWGGGSLGIDLGADVDRKALLLGRCLIADGRLRAANHRWTEAANQYFQALAFASDLAQADFEANLVGLSVALSSLQALGHLAGRLGQDTAALDDLLQKVWRLEGLPTVDAGLRRARLDIASNLAIETRRDVQRYRSGFARIVPKYASAAWRLWKSDRLLRLLESLQTADPLARRDLVGEIRQRATDPAVVVALPDHLVGAMESGTFLMYEHRAVAAAIGLELWRARHGNYPADLAQLPETLPRVGLKYERHSDTDGFQITLSSGPSAGTVLFTSTPEVRQAEQR